MKVYFLRNQWQRPLRYALFGQLMCKLPIIHQLWLNTSNNGFLEGKPLYNFLKLLDFKIRATATTPSWPRTRPLPSPRVCSYSVAIPLTKITSCPAQPVEPYTKVGWEGGTVNGLCHWLRKKYTFTSFKWSFLLHNGKGHCNMPHTTGLREEDSTGWNDWLGARWADVARGTTAP